MEKSKTVMKCDPPPPQMIICGLKRGWIDGIRMWWNIKISRDNMVN